MRKRSMLLGAMLGALVCASTLLGGCSTTSRIVVGQARPAIDPAQVRIYLKPPAKYEEIAVIEASSRASMAFGDQAQTEKVLERLRTEAAALGANGVLLKDIGEAGGPTVGTSIGSATASGSHSSLNLFGISVGLGTELGNKLGKATAIHVIDE